MDQCVIVHDAIGGGRYSRNIHLKFPNGWTASFFSKGETAVEVWGINGEKSFPDFPVTMPVWELGEFLTKLSEK